MFAMSGNPVLELVSEIIYDFSQSFLPYGMFWRHRDRARAYAIHRRDLAKAILDHDPEIALVHSRRCQHLVVQWAREDEELDPRREPQTDDDIRVGADLICWRIRRHDCQRGTARRRRWGERGGGKEW